MVMLMKMVMTIMKMMDVGDIKRNVMKGDCYHGDDDENWKQKH